MFNRAAWVHATLFSLLITFPIAFVLTAVNLGFGDTFMFFFIRSSIVAFIVSVPLSVILGPLVSRMTRQMLPVPTPAAEKVRD
ncbi:DUF2798 domain-containing protein [Lysinibacter sp. HNR]|uniref:DUF2798 domain-containing protein n=1 Tax=Lysinibacter sp. HNR TaxID=3031408 RepID=UPI002435BB22|nr:DUF2798 domain-containing protein [Lysinibacter sp. HNR]WGD36883.1 DUF2798 domain-containing protein [Lysinibacter sp. HNR]